MERRRLGGSDVQASVIGLGCNNFGMKIDEAASHAVLAAALDTGIDFLDTADLYGETDSERFIGSFGQRDAFVITTKFGGLAKRGEAAFATRDTITGFLEDSLRRLRTDYVDLYQIHYPDPLTPIDETLAALAGIVASGKARAVGCSNFSAEMLEASEVASKAAGLGFASAQNEWNLLSRDAERELVPACERHGVSLLPYFPLASGMLTGKYQRDAGYPEGSRLDVMPDYFAHVASDANFTRVDALAGIARERGMGLAELALGWLASQPSVASVIAGATTPEQVRANAAAGAVRFSPEDRDLIAAAAA